MKTIRIVIQKSEFWQSRDASIAKNRFMNHDVQEIAVDIRANFANSAKTFQNRRFALKNIHEM